MSKAVYLPFADGQWHLTMGLKPLQLSDWIEIDESFANQLTLKTQLLSQRYSDVFACISGSENGQREVLDLLLAHLLQYFPRYYQRQGDRLLNQVTGQVWHLADFEANPLDLAGRIVQEDLCLMLPGDCGYVLAAASLCFPSRWKLQEKLGQPMAQIHQHVPGYADKLKRPVDNFFASLKPNYPGYRLNWGIVDSPDLFLDQDKGQQDFNPTITADNAGERLWLRVERQTLRRLDSGGILFTIRTYVHPLYSLMDDLMAIRSLVAAIRQIPAPMQIYKNLLPIREALLAYLDRVGTQDG